MWIETTALRMKSKEVQKSLEHHIGIMENPEITMVMWDTVAQTWLIGVESEEVLAKWSHLTEWDGVPVRFRVMTISAL